MAERSKEAVDAPLGKRPRPVGLALLHPGERRWLYALAGAFFALSSLSKLFGPLSLAGCLLLMGWELVAVPSQRRETLTHVLIMLIVFVIVFGAALAPFWLSGVDVLDALIGHHLRQGEELAEAEVVGKGLSLYWHYLWQYPLLVIPALVAAVRGLVKRGRETVLAWQVPTVLAYLLLSRSLGHRHLMYLLPSLSLLFALALSAWSTLRLPFDQVYSDHGGTARDRPSGQILGVGCLIEMAKAGGRRLPLVVSLVIIAAMLGTWLPIDVDHALATDDVTEAVVAFIQEHTEEEDFVLCDYPGLNFFAQRRAPYSGAELSHVTTTNGRVTGRIVRDELVRDGVSMVLIDTSLLTGHHLVFLPDYASLHRYLSTYYEHLGQVSRAAQTLDVYWTDSPPTTPADPLAIGYPMEARLGEQIVFRGYDLSAFDVPTGGTLYLTLYFEALGATETRWSVFTHLLSSDNQVWAQHDKPPLDDRYPTIRWASGEVVDDDYRLVIAPDAPPGAYCLEVGMYNWMTGERLPAFAADGQRLLDDRILLDCTVMVRN